MTGSGSGRTRSTWRQKAGGLVPSRLRQRSQDAKRSRGAAELSVLVVSGSLVAGVFFGQGISDTAVDVADGLTWLSDDPSGQIIQVNPATGALEVKQDIGNPGDDVEVTGEGNGSIYVADHTSGRLLAFDLTSILVSGQRRISTGGVVDTLHNDDGVFLVDSEQSTIAAMDPQSTEALGTIWVARSGLADAVVDGEGVIWALEDDGTMHQLTWSNEQMAFDDEESDVVEGSGPGSVLVGHDRGVTVFGPDQGLVEQVGTDHDFYADAPKVIGKIYAPEKSPSDLVPVASADNGYVVILTPEGIKEVDMGSISCDEPGTPEVFHEQVYVPCTGEGRVVRLGRDGTRADNDIPTPGSDDPELVIDDDSLIINAPGAPQGVVVHGDGRTTTIVREDPDLPANGLTSNATPPQNPAQELLDDLLDLGGDDEEPDSPPPSNPSTPTSPSTPGNPTSPTPGGPTVTGGGGNGGGPTPPKCNGTSQGPGSSSNPPDGNGKGKGGKGKGGKNKNCPNVNPPTGPTGPTTGTGERVTAPTDVVADAGAEGQVKVTWKHSGIPKPDGFIVRSSAGETYPALKGWVRQAFVDVTPGQATSFTVTAVLGQIQATSYASNSVTSTARPGVPEVAATSAYQGNNDQEVFAVQVSWSGAAANGEPITSYDVSVTTPDGTRSQQVPGNQSSLGFTWTCSRMADADCKVGGDYTVTVVARSALGGGDPGIYQGDAPVQPDPPLPTGGRKIVDGPATDDADVNGAGSIVLRLRPQADWSRFPGTCSWSLDSGAPQQVACNATSVTVAYANGVIYEPDSGNVDHTIVFFAENGRGKATSAWAKFTTRQTPQPVPVQPEDPQNPGGTCPQGQVCPIP